MRTLTWVLGILMAVAVVFFGAQIVASETGEVVILYTDDGGDEAATRLWVVDHDGHQWLRAGGASGWYARLVAEPRVELERAGVRRPYLAVPEPSMSGAINALMKEKYGWREDVVSVLTGSRERAVAIRLAPAQ